MSSVKNKTAGPGLSREEILREVPGAALHVDRCDVSDLGSLEGFAADLSREVPRLRALVHNAGARAIVHSDDPSGSQRLNQEAAKALAAGRAIGIQISEDDAIKWLTINPAWSLGLQDRIGSLEVGKNADVVLWSHNPFSVYARPERVWIDGSLRYDRFDPTEQWRTDFELGFVPVNRAEAPSGTRSPNGGSN